MASILQICIVLTATWITLSNGKHLWKEKELEKMELIEQMLKKEVQEQLAEEKAKEKEEAEAAPPPPPPPPPAPVIEVIPGEFIISKPFLPPEVKAPDGGKVERSLNTDISGALVKYETYVPIYGELPPKEEVPPPPPPAAPAPLLPPVLPPPAPVNPPPPPPPPTPIKWVPNFIGPNEAITLYRPPIIVQPPPPAPEPVPPPPPASPPPPPPPPVIPLPPPKEPMKPSKYAVYLGDMFLKLMGQLLSRARLTLNRLTGPPAVSPEEAGV